MRSSASWSGRDVDCKERVVYVRRSFTRGVLKIPKTEAATRRDPRSERLLRLSVPRVAATAGTVPESSLVYAISARASCADPAATAAVRLRVDPPALRDDLLEFLRASSCLAVRYGENEIEAHRLDGVGERHDRAAIAAAVQGWQQQNLTATVEELPD